MANRTVVVVTGSSLILTPSSFNTYYYITTAGFATLTLPSSTLPSQGGAFWQIKNGTTSFLTITLPIRLGLTSPLIIPPLDDVTLVVSPTSSDSLLLF